MSRLPGQAGKNFAQVLGGQTVGAVLALLALYLMARSLSPAELGIVVLLQTYVVTMRELLNLKLFEAVVRFGVPKLDAGDLGALRRLLRHTFKVDLASALAAAVVAVGCVSAAGPLIGWQPTHTPLAVGFSLVLLASAVGTSRGMLRLYGRFDLLGLIGVAASTVRLLGALAALLLEAGIAGFAMAWALSLLVEYMLTNYCGWREAYRQMPHPLRAQRGAAFSTEFPGWWSFTNVVYWQSNLDLLPKHIATLLAGILLGPSGAGLFRLAREVSVAAAKPATMLRSAVFPDLTRLWHQGDPAFLTLCLRPVLWAGPPSLALVVLVLVFGTPAVEMLLGADYLPLVPLAVVLLIAASLELMTASLRPAGYATNQAGVMLWIQVIATVVYLPAFVICSHWFGLVGAGFAALLATVITISAMTSVLWRTTRPLRL